MVAAPDSSNNLVVLFFSPEVAQLQLLGTALVHHTNHPLEELVDSRKMRLLLEPSLDKPP